MTKTYYSLRFERNDALHKAGEQLINADATLRIGQTDECEVRLPNATQYEDALLAVIRKDDEGWCLIRVSPYQEHEVRVNGLPVDYVHRLSDGDRLAFCTMAQELLFTVRSDDHYTSNGVVLVKKGFPRWLVAALVALPLLLFGALFLFIDNNKSKIQLTEEMIDTACRSVFQIRVDSVELVAIAGGDTTRMEMCDYEVSGTAFLTADSLLVTARHCIEPWLNTPDSLLLDTAQLSMPAKWALQAETRRQMEDSVQWHLISHCSILQLDSSSLFICNITSDDFHMDTSRDEVIEFGDFDSQYFWRSIVARPRRADMMLGDIAYLRATPQLMAQPMGTIRRSNAEEMRTLLRKPNRPLVILGFPETDNVGAKDPENSKDELRKRMQFDQDGWPETVLAHNGQIGPGFSGGPVLVRDGSDWCVVGVISVTDKKNRDRTYSVPITEIDRMEKQMTDEQRE